MESLFVVLLCLILGITLQSILHRILRRRHSLSLRITWVYLCMCVPLFAGLSIVNSEVFLSSTLLFICSASLISFLYVGVVLGGETPSSMILHALIRQKQMTEKDILHLFSEDVLIWKRIGDLRNSGLVSWNAGIIKVTAKGQRVISCIHVYEQLFHRGHGG